MNRNLVKLCAVICILASITILKPTPSSAEDLDRNTYFDGKTITYYVGASPDGGYGRYAKLIGHAMEKYLPGSNVLIIPRPEANGIVALNELYIADPNELTIMAINSGLLLAQVSNKKLIKFDLAKFNWIGKAGSEARFLGVHPKTNITSFSQLSKTGKSLKFASGGFNSASTIQTKLINQIFNLDIDILLGFRGSEKNAAMIKGEIDGLLTSESNISKLEKSNAVNLLVRFGDSKNKKYLNVPNAEDFAVSAEQKNLISRISIMTKLGRLSLASPNMSKPILEALRTAYELALKDTDLLSLAAKQGLPIDPLSGVETGKLVSSFLEPNPVFDSMIKQAYAKK